MTAIVADTEDFASAKPAKAAPARPAQTASGPRWLRIVGLVLLAGVGLALGVIAGVILVISTGLVAFC